jgi:hypothetical protein
MPHIAANCPAQAPFNLAPVQSCPSAADRKNVSLPASGSRPGAGQPGGEPLISALAAQRCPACGARLAPAAEWCSLCYADLRPAPAPPATAASRPAPGREALPAPRSATGSPPATATDQATAGAPPASPSASAASPLATGIARPTWPCAGCGASVDVDLDACLACGTPFLGALRNSAVGIDLPVVGNLGRFSDRSRVVLGAAAGLLIAFVLVVLTALLGR